MIRLIQIFTLLFILFLLNCSSIEKPFGIRTNSYNAFSYKMVGFADERTYCEIFFEKKIVHYLFVLPFNPVEKEEIPALSNRKIRIKKIMRGMDIFYTTLGFVFSIITESFVLEDCGKNLTNYEKIIEKGEIASNRKLEKSPQNTITDQRGLSLAEYEDFRKSLPSSNKDQIPDKLFKKRTDSHSVLKLKKREDRDLYYYIQMDDKNRSDRFSAYSYFSKDCYPLMKPAKEKLKINLEKINELEEKNLIRKTISEMENCEPED